MNGRERIRRLVDGELDAREEASLVADAARDPELGARLGAARVVVEQLALLRAEDGAPREDLVERSVRGAIRAREAYEARPLRRLDWLWEPRAVRVRLVSLVAAGALAAFGVALALRSASGHPPEARIVRTPAGERGALAVDARPQSARVAMAETAPVRPVEVPVRFVLPAEGATTVAVAGDFNDWRADADPLRDPDGDGAFVGTLRLPPGTYAYMFVVDGERWVPDPYAEAFRDDGFGNRNAVLRIR